MTKVAALYVDPRGPYPRLLSPEMCWDAARDARTYDGPWPVVAHPPCERWGRYWGGGPATRVKRVLGDDGGCFAAALASVRRWGGAIEHPEASHAWRCHGLARPPRAGGWVRADDHGGLTCCVEQGHYGHSARKATWLYYVGSSPPPALIWGPSQGQRLDEGFHSREERLAARAAGRQPVKRLSKRQCVETPWSFAELLISLARGAR